MPGSRPIALLTDFGEGDFYAGILRAVIASSAPASRLFDLSHGVASHDVNLASYVLALSLDYLPVDAVVVAVVDPGVGGARRALIAEVDTRAVVTPDNGLVSDVLASGAPARIVAIDDSLAARATGSRVRGATFHGRDVFAPVAAALARGAGAGDFGVEAGGVVMLRDVPSVSIDAGRVTGTGRMIDHFGNILTDITRGVVERVFGTAPCRVSVNGVDAGPLRRTYGDGERGRLIAIVNSWDRVEAAVREGSAARRFAGLEPGAIRFELRSADAD